jgi:glycosyltransferase involved in cell wall biosynthesis
MKLAIVIPGFQADERDWCIPAFTNLAQQLSESAEVHVFTLRYPARKDAYSIGKVRVHAVGGGAFKGRRLPGLSLLNLWREGFAQVAREHRLAKFDAVVGIWATESGWLATQIAAWLRIPSVVHLAGGELVWLPRIRYGNRRRGLARSLVAGALDKATILTVPSGPVRSQLLAIRPGLASKVRNWAPGVDTCLFSPAEPRVGSSGGVFKFITVGSLIPVKGHAWLLRAAAEMRRMQPGARFVLQTVGTGPLLAGLRRQAAELGLEGYVDFSGEVRHDKLPDIYRAADAFVLSSWHEAECMAALEAMACGLPWVTPPVGALSDCVVKGEPSGIPVRERSARAMAEAMLTMMSLRPEERLAWGAAARRRVEEDYQLEKQTESLLGVLAELTQAGSVVRISESQSNPPTQQSSMAFNRAARRGLVPRDPQRRP